MKSEVSVPFLAGSRHDFIKPGNQLIGVQPQHKKCVLQAAEYNIFKQHVITAAQTDAYEKYNERSHMKEDAVLCRNQYIQLLAKDLNSMSTEKELPKSAQYYTTHLNMNNLGSIKPL